MLADYLSSRPNKPVPLLVVEDNEDHQLLIAYSLKARVPRANPIFAHTAPEALTHLQSIPAQAPDFPKLILLDLFLPDLSQGWALLTAFRTQYPFLPIVVLSSSKDPAIIRKAYELGAHSFLSKPSSLGEWESAFQSLHEYWFKTISLPMLSN